MSVRERTHGGITKHRQHMSRKLKMCGQSPLMIPYRILWLMTSSHINERFSTKLQKLLSMQRLVRRGHSSLRAVQRVGVAFNKTEALCPNLTLRAFSKTEQLNISGKTSRSNSARNMSSGKEFRLFEDENIAKFYALYRPTYTVELYSAIYKYCESDPNFSFNKALDVGCGSGQSTQPLKEKFTKVFGQDISEAQIKQAQKTNLDPEESICIDFSVGSAEDLSSMEEASLDLITCAQCFHWFDFEKVFGEMRKVLKPSGVIAVYGYGLLELREPEATATIHGFWRETLKEYWPHVRELVNNRFKDVELPFDDFQRIDDLVIERRMPLSSFVGYLNSVSAYQKLLKDDPGSTVMMDIKTKLIKLYRSDWEENEDFHLDVTWPIYVLLGRNTAR